MYIPSTSHSDDGCKSQNKETQTELNDTADLQALEQGGEM